LSWNIFDLEKLVSRQGRGTRLRASAIQGAGVKKRQ
jgi:hypothetical protein